MADQTRNPNGIRYFIRDMYRMKSSKDSGMLSSLLTSFSYIFWLNQVDGDVKNPPLAAGSNAAPVSGSSAGSGYSAFA